MIGLYLQAGLKKSIPISSSLLEGLQRAPVLWQTYLPRAKHYHRYCQLVDWQSSEVVHPFYWQVRGLSLQLRLLTHAKSPFRLLGLIHLNNRVDEYLESRVDIPCELVARFGEVFQHRRGLAVEVIVTGTQRGKRVYNATGTYLMRMKELRLSLPAYEGLSTELSDQARMIDEMSFSGSMVRRYAWLSGDINPIHLSTLSAKAFGFKRAIVHGMYSGACALSALNRQQGLQGQVVTLAFKQPMFLPAQASLLMESDTNSTQFALVSHHRQQNEICHITGVFS